MSLLWFLLRRGPKILFFLAFRKKEFPFCLRQSLIDLGPVFIKIGQVLSTRRDLLPEAYIAALMTLRDDIPPVPAETIRPFIARNLDLGAFESFDFTPFAAGAVAQVHVGRLKQGRKVAVKVIRPGIRETIQKNFRSFFRLARILARLGPGFRALNPIGMVETFQRFLEAQLDLDFERANYQRFRVLNDVDMYIPQVFEELSSSSVLVTEFVEAVMPEEYRKLPIAAGRLAEKIDGLIEKMIFVYGFCHADLHPGNFFWNRRGQVVLVDLGLVYALSREDRNHLLTFWIAFIDRYYDFAIRYYVEHFTVPSSPEIPVDRTEAFEKILEVIKKRILEVKGKLDFSLFFFEITKVLASYRLQPRSDYFQIILTTIAIDGYAVYLDPSFDTMEATRRKRREEIEAATLTAGAENFLFGSNGSQAVPLFEHPDDTLEKANYRRDLFVLDALKITPDQFLIHLGCGRGRFLDTARKRGYKVLGLAASESEHQHCREQGIPCVRSSWEDWEQSVPKEYPRADAVVLLEFLEGSTTLHELATGFSAVKWKRLFSLLHGKVKKGGRLFIQCLQCPPDFPHDPCYAEDYQDLYREFSWLGLVSLPVLTKAASPYFSLDRNWDQSMSLVPFYRTVDENFSRLIGKLGNLFVPDMVYVGQKLNRRLLDLAERKILKLNRMVFTAT